MIEHSPCEVCKGAVKPHVGEGTKKWLRRRTCSRECMSKLHSIIKTGKPRRHHPRKRFCQATGCDNPILRRDGETTSNFNRRCSCSPECALAMRDATAAATRERRCDGWPKVTGNLLPDNCFVGMDVQTSSNGRVTAVATHVDRWNHLA